MAHGTYEKPARPIAVKNVPTRLATAGPKGATKMVRKFKNLVRRDIWTKNDPDHPVNWKDDKVWKKIDDEGRYHRADEMLVSCGTVTIDQPDSPQPKVLTVFNRNIGIFQLPKGRKNFDEGYLDAALRETAEETGVAAQPLRLRFGSRSTPPKPTQIQAPARGTKYGVEDKLTGITEGLSNESIGVSEYPDPATGAWRHIHWYAAKPLGGIIRDESRMTDEEDREKFTTFWFPEAEAISNLKLKDEKFMVQIAFAYLRSMTASDWASNREQESYLGGRDDKRDLTKS
ncbi:hypothetical protein GGS26DRAFT_545389 [Hypomontagnella submonticulosa]|nr:hypothetical protein GGS26DRAFT_545389 [Hypomontagnella submonticulosa]